MRACRRYGTDAVQQLTADGDVLASFTGAPAGYGPFGIVVVEYNNGLPSTLAVAGYDSNAIHFFQRTP